LARALEREIVGQVPSLDVRINPGTGSILIQYQEGVTDRSFLVLLEVSLAAVLSRGLPAEERPQPAIHPIRDLLRRVRPESLPLAPAVVLSNGGTLLNFLPYLGHSLSIAIAKNGGSQFLSMIGIRSVKTQLGVVAGLTLFSMGVNLLAENVRRRFWMKVANQMERSIQLSVIDKLMHLDDAYLESQKTGNLMKIVQADSKQIYEFFSTWVHDAIQKITVVVVVGITLFTISPMLALITFLPLPFVILSSRYFQKRVVQRFGELGQREGDFSQLLANSLSGVATIKSFTAEDYEATRFRETSDYIIDARKRAFDISASYAGLTRILTSISFTLAIMVGGMLFTDGAINFTVYSLLLFTVPQLTWVISGLDSNYDLYQRTMSAANRLLSLLSREPALISGPMHLATAEVAGEVALRSVRFGYSEQAQVFEDLNIHAAPRQNIALVGSSGSGKTTVIKLLMRFYDVDSGSVQIDGKDVRALDVHDLRRMIGYVSQDIYLFHGTIFDNIAYGRRGASGPEVVEAARAAEAHEFIERLPDGYQTVVGERGEKLSRGQRQRISIARVLLKNPPILIFDEATSALDAGTEASILRSIDTVSRGRTTIVVAHRLTTIQHSDCIYLLSNGRVVEQGTHEDLLRSGSMYQALWRIQLSNGNLA
jgi:ATP-binding cassette subfamily B protein